jgi:hypothetical protein
MEFELLTWCCDKYNNTLALLCYAQSIAWSCMIANLFVRNTFKLIYPCVKKCVILIRWSLAGAQFTLAWTLGRGRGLWFSLCFMALIKEIRLCTISCAYCTRNNRRQVKTVSSKRCLCFRESCFKLKVGEFCKSEQIILLSKSCLNDIFKRCTLKHSS